MSASSWLRSPKGVAVLTAGERATQKSPEMAAPVRPSGSCYFPEDRS